MLYHYGDCAYQDCWTLCTTFHHSTDIQVWTHGRLSCVSNLTKANSACVILKAGRGPGIRSGRLSKFTQQSTNGYNCTQANSTKVTKQERQNTKVFWLYLSPSFIYCPLKIHNKSNESCEWPKISFTTQTRFSPQYLLRHPCVHAVPG